MVSRIYGGEPRHNEGFWIWTFNMYYTNPNSTTPLVKFNEDEFVVLTDYFELARSLFFTMRNQNCAHIIESIIFPCYVIYDHVNDFLDIMWHKEEKPKDFLLLKETIKKVKELEFYE